MFQLPAATRAAGVQRRLRACRTRRPWRRARRSSSRAAHAPRDDVDDARERVAAVHGGIGAARDFDALDVGDVERREVERAAARVRGVVDAHAVDQHQRVVRVGAAHVQRAGAAAPADLVDVHAGHAPQQVGEFRGLLDVEILAREHGDVGGDLVRRSVATREPVTTISGCGAAVTSAGISGKQHPEQRVSSEVG